VSQRAAVERGHQERLVDGHRDGAARLDLVERRCAGDAEVRHAPRGPRQELQVRIGLDGRERRDGHVADRVQAAGAQLRDARRLVFDHAQHHAVEVRQLGAERILRPVRRVPLQRELLTRLPRARPEHQRARAGRAR